MLRDVFYFGNKPNVHPRERPAQDIDHARSLCATDHFWVINEFCDYRGFDWDFDFDFLPDDEVWTEYHNNVWPSNYQKDSGTWLCSKDDSKVVVYRNDVAPIKRKNIKTDNWVCLNKIDETKFDFGWHPDPTEPPYIYCWGNKFYPVELGPALQYHVPGATQIKYMNETVELLPDWDRWEILQNIDKNSFDFTWLPDPREPPYIYVFGNQHYSAEKMPTVKYHTEGATEFKYMPTPTVKLAQDKTNYKILADIDVSKFDFSWKPDPDDPPYIYVFGNQWHIAEIEPTIEYHIPGATDKKYINTFEAYTLADMSKWKIHCDIDREKFDFTWRPHPSDPPYIYVWGNKYISGVYKPTIEYIVEGATEIKYVHDNVEVLPERDRWIIPDNIDTDSFDFTWRPGPLEPPFIYQFGTQWQKTGGPRYVVDGATEVSYVNTQRATALPRPEKFVVQKNYKIKNFDYSWHPDDNDPPYNYVFGNEWNTAEVEPTIIYPVKNAKDFKYVSDTVLTAELAPNKNNWVVLEKIDEKLFNFSWIPNPHDPPYIYVFGNQHYAAEKMPTVLYKVDGATDYKYINNIKATLVPLMDRWKELLPIDKEKFDFSWHPDPNDPPYIYVFGNQWHSAEKQPTLEYHVPEATDKKYVRDTIAYVLPNLEHWEIPSEIDTNNFDFTWTPDPGSPPYIYVFGNQYYEAEKMPTVLYKVEGATDYKYINNIKATLVPLMDRWKELIPIDKEKFDFSWHPDPNDPPYIYVFGNQWHSAEKQPTLEYHVPEATDKKYVQDVIAQVLFNPEYWQIPPDIDTSSFDFTWTPDPGSPPYIYEFATQWNNRGGPKYIVKGATEYKYIEEVKAKLLPSKDNWVIPDNVNIDDFDFSWRPHPEAPPYIYEFATQWNNRGGPKYIVEGATEYKYVEDIQAKLLSSRDNWTVPQGVNVDDFDFSWHPHPEAPPYIYQFGTLQDDADGPIYTTPNNNGETVKLPRVYKTIEQHIEVSRYYIKTTLQDLIQEHPNEVFWAMREIIDYTNFDFTWRPDVINVSWESDYVHVFGSPEAEITQTYFVNAKSYLKGKQDFKYIEADKKADADYLATLFKQNDMFYVDRGNTEAKQRYDLLKQRFPSIQKTRFLNTWVDTINRCTNRSSTDLCWILNSEYDYSEFNFNYYPNPWQTHMVHVFGTQWSQWGHTYVVNREKFSEDTKYIKIIEHLSNLNFVKDRHATASNNLYDIWLIDHGNDLSQVKNILETKSSGKSINIIPYDNSYLQTFKNLVKKIPDKKEDYIWLCSSVCDYTNFDFTYTVDPFSRDNLHIFPSDQQKFGDTFFVDVNKTKEVIETIDKLEAYPKANYNPTLRTKRLAAPIINVTSDTYVGTLDQDYAFPYAVFQTETFDVLDQEPISLWSEETKNIVITSTGATRIIVPQEARKVVKKELYDYPYIKTASKLVSSTPMDIVFLSNGEKCAEENYEHLITVAKYTKNRIVRVDGVNGRVQAYHAVAEASNTPWAFTVFAKLKVNAKFNWNWQPDRMQAPKHYIFHAKNPVNGLEYGHQGMIAYNKKLTLANQGHGLDFTLDDPHETIKLSSGTATFNTDPYSTWRTAFREVIKLQSDYSDVAAERLKVWTEVARGDFAQDCLQGAKDAVDFYDSVMGDIDELKKSYEWAWLKEFYRKKYS